MVHNVLSNDYINYCDHEIFYQNLMSFRHHIDYIFRFLLHKLATLKKEKIKISKTGYLVGRLMGIEPTTHGVTVRCSTN